jgi:transcriptional/translational regulatory protein YebC/TACO1
MLPVENVAEDDLFDTAVEYGAEELDKEDDRYVISAPAEKIYELEEVLRSKGNTVDSVEIGLEPASTITVTGQDAKSLLQLLDALDELEDIQKVYSNCDIPVEELVTISA